VASRVFWYDLDEGIETGLHGLPDSVSFGDIERRDSLRDVKCFRFVVGHTDDRFSELRRDRKYEHGDEREK
jgi:hypothetical protein